MLIRFYGGLNDFLKKSKRNFLSEVTTGRKTIKDVIESIGVPHTEVALIVLNGKQIDLEHHVHEKDYVSVYPSFINIAPEATLMPPIHPPIRFIAAAHLGKLARYIRMLGFDCVYGQKIDDVEIIDLSLIERRIILTRDVGLLKINRVEHGCFIRSQNPKEQLMEVVVRYDLIEKINPFYRCMLCNGKLLKVEKDHVIHSLPPNTRNFFTKFYQCDSCRKVYWEGSHYENMKKWINELRSVKTSSGN